MNTDVLYRSLNGSKSVLQEDSVQIQEEEFLYGGHITTREALKSDDVTANDMLTYYRFARYKHEVTGWTAVEVRARGEGRFGDHCALSFQ